MRAVYDVAVIEAIAAVSFAETPPEEIGTRANQLLSLGWRVRDRGDPWVILVAKNFDESERLPEAELHDVMGDKNDEQSCKYR